MMYDAAIVGTGPAGISAALTLKANNKDFVLIGSPGLSDKVERAERIANYPGLPLVSGAEMNAAFHRQLEQLEISVTDRMVTGIMDMGSHWALMAGSDFYEAKTVILATGVAAVGTLPGETELLGRGVSYCATCDGNLYRGKRIAVICNAARFEHEVRFLADIAEKVWYFPLYKDVSVAGENVDIMSARPTRVNTEGGRVSSLTLTDGSDLPVNGVFCLRDSVSLGTLLPGLTTENGHIAVNRDMQTSLRGCFAAGDCTGRPYQYVKAAGEGNVAAHSAIAFLA